VAPCPRGERRTAFVWIETLKGPGQLLPILISDPLPELFPWQCSRGPSFDYDWADVLVPAHSTTTLVVPMTANVPSWPGTDYTPEVFEDVVSGQSETETPIAVPRVTMGGPTGVHIEITAHTHGRLSTGAAVALTGSTSPPDPGAIVRVRVRAFVMQQNSWLGAAATVLFSRVRTDARGRFRIEGWHPRRPGVYEVLSRIDHPRHALQADKNCAPAIYVTTPR
jgi:hypothetical protein